MSIFIRIWLLLIVFMAASSAVLLPQIQQQIKPNARQIMEETLADSANILAATLAQDIYDKKVQTPAFRAKINNVIQHPLNAHIWSFRKERIALNFYITDAQGIVIFDSQNAYNVGKDFSRWNDVYNTLRGKYGVRSSKENPADANSPSVMYVAAPVKHNNKLIAVLTLSKPSTSVQQYIDATQRKLVKLTGIYLLIALILSAVVAWLMSKNIHALRRYALSLAPAKLKPKFLLAKELNELADAIAHMRGQLEDKEYIKNYVRTLTHELKSPLTAIKANAEILQEPLLLTEQQKFAAAIEQQSDKLKNLIDRLLMLSKLEDGREKLNLTTVNLVKLINKILTANHARLTLKNIDVNFNYQTALITAAIDEFWFTQALNNLIDNAIDFADENSQLSIELSQQQQQIRLQIKNCGPAIPEYALNKIFQRYFSLARPNGGHKGTGIGLNLVKEIVQQHHGAITIDNYGAGVIVCLTLPIAMA